MGQSSGLVNFLAQKGERLGMKGFFQDLDRKGLAEDLSIGGQVHDPHPALTELALDAVAVGKRLTDRQPVMGGASLRAGRRTPHTFVV